MPQKKSRPSARPSAARSAGGKARPERTLDARPDTLDFRDRMFEPTLVEVPTSRSHFPPTAGGEFQS